MNNTYTLIWNTALGLWQVAGELAKGQGKNKAKIRVQNNKPMRLSLMAASVAMAVSTLSYAATDQVSTALTGGYELGVTNSTAGTDKIEITSAGSITTSTALGNAVLVNQTAYTGFDNAGTVTSSQSAPSVLIDLNSVTTSADFLNTGTIENTGASSAAHALRFSLPSANVSGAITNAGTITSATGNAIQFHGIAGTVSGGLLNNTSTGVITSYRNAIDFSSTALLAGNITNAGTITSSNGNGIYFGGSTAGLNGSIANTGTIRSAMNAAIYANNSAIITGGITNSGSGALLEGDTEGIRIRNGSVVQGSIDNQAAITANDGTAIHIQSSSSVAGDITNTGSNAVLTSYDEGIMVSASSVTGDINNSGSINTNWGDGIAVDAGATVGGNIENSGTIVTTQAARTNKSGIEVDDSVVTGSISNSGTITANGDNGIAVWGNNTGGATGKVLGGIVNSGTINAYGESLDLDDAATIQNGIANTGTMTSQTTSAIEIDETTVVSGGITNSGNGVISGVNGIEINANSTVSGGLSNSGVIKASSGSAVQLLSNATVDSITNSGTIFSASSHALESNASSITGGVVNTSTGQLVGSLNGAMDITNQGTVYLKTGVTSGSHATTGTATSSTITGNYVQSSTGVLHVALDSNTTRGTTYSSLDVTGNVTLTNNAKIDVDVKNSGNNVTIGDVFSDVLKATGTLTTSTFSVTDNSALLKFTASQSANGVHLTAAQARTILQSVTNEQNKTGEGGATILDTLGIATGDMGTIISEFNSLSTEADVSQAVSQTLPLITGSMASVNNQSSRSINRIVQARVASNLGLSSGGNMVEDRNAWIKPFTTATKQSDSGAIEGYKANTWGFVTGVDGDIAGQQKLGLAFAYADSDVSSNSTAAPQSADVQMYQIIGYGSQLLPSGGELNFQFDYGHNENNGKRTVNFGALNRTASSSYNSTTTHAGVGYGQVFNQQVDTSYLASVRLDYTRMIDRAYIETGADALNLSVDKKTVTELMLAIDGKMSKQLEQGTLTVNLGVGYDFHAGADTITASYSGGGASFITTGINKDAVLAMGGIGYIQSLEHDVEMSMRYDIETRTGFTNQTASVKLRKAF